MFVKFLLMTTIGLAGASSWYNDLFWWMGSRKGCYDGYGCFSTDYPFSNTEGFLPQSPDYLNVRIQLYTRQNRNNAIDVTEGVGKTFDSTKDIKIIIHGYMNRMDVPWLTEMKDAFLQRDDVNVLILDWERAAGSFSYHQSVANTRIVAAITAKHIQQLQDTHRVHASSIHIVGFSLGAHLAGYIGSRIQDVGRITGLDPAGPNFEGTEAVVRLDPSDATFVDVIHTDADELFNVELSPGFGTLQPMGHVDFYVNGGSDQPGCATNVNQHLMRILRGNFNPISNFGCNHIRAIEIFIESINSDCKFLSVHCPLNLVQTDTCNNSDDSEYTYMGYHASKNNGTGTYLTNTRGTSPFCRS